MLFRLITMQCPNPFVCRRLFRRGITTEGSHYGQDHGRNESALAEDAARLRQQIDGEQLQHKGRSQRRFHRQQHFAIAFRVQGIAMMVGMAAGIIKGIPPADQAEEIKEELVKPLGLEHRAVPEFVSAVSPNKGGNRAVKEKRDEKRQPKRLGPKVEYESAGDNDERKVTAGEEPALGIAPPR